MNVALIGFALQNESVLRYFQQQGDTVTVCDQNPDTVVPAGVASQLGDTYLDNLDGFDLIVRTDGVHPRLILDKNPGVSSKITTAVNIFFETCETPIIGVTGTKGKGTTSTLITNILAAAGKKVVLAGNIGIPVLDVLPQAAEADYVVLELSSFQLLDCKYSPRIAVCLMVVPEHLNWHEHMEEYLRAKQNLFAHQTAEDLAIFNRLSTLSQEIAAVSKATKLSYEVPRQVAEPSKREGAYVDGDTIFMEGAPVCQANEIALLGRHNLENVCAAIAATWELVDHNVEVIKSVVSSFTGMEHRLEFVRELNGVKYYNDSFGTTPETAIVAIRAFQQPKVVILGGSDKGANFNELAQTVAASDVRRVILIGNTSNKDFPSASPKLEASLKAAGVEAITSLVKAGPTNMEAIVAAAQAAARPGDVVLLSTGCASFDIFENYKQRGELFKQAVQALA